MASNDSGPVGGSLEEFLAESGIRNDVYDAAIKRVLAWQMEEARKAAAITKTELAATVGTTRSQIDRALDPENVAVSIDTLNRVASALGKRLKIELVDGV